MQLSAPLRWLQLMRLSLFKEGSVRHDKGFHGRLSSDPVSLLLVPLNLAYVFAYFVPQLECLEAALEVLAFKNHANYMP